VSDYLDPSLVDVVLPEKEQGYPAELAAEDTYENLVCAAAEANRDLPNSMFVEPRDYEARAKELDATNGWAMNRVDRFTNQGGGGGGYSTHECTTHSGLTNFLVAWNRQAGIIYPDGPRKDYRYEESAVRSFWGSCLSVYAEANPRQWGGANVRQIVEIMARRGVLPDKIQPREYGFKHTLQGTCGKGGINQSRGEWVPLSKFPEGWQETAKHFKPLEIVFPKSREEAMSLLLNGFALSVGRSGHAVPICKWDWQRKLFPYPDSYDLIRYDSSLAWQGSFAIISTTIPDDWSKPAGG
jgi:hypothetical protein